MSASPVQIYVRTCEVHAKIFRDSLGRYLRDGGAPDHLIEGMDMLVNAQLFMGCFTGVKTKNYGEMLADEAEMFQGGSNVLFRLRRKGLVELGPVGQDYDYERVLRDWETEVGLQVEV